MAGLRVMAAYRDPHPGRIVGVAFVLYLLAAAGLLGIVLWRLWTEVLHAWPT